MAFNKNKVMTTAQKYVEKGAYDKAIAEYLKVLKEEPEDVRAWLKLGDCYAKKGSRKEATSTYLKVAEYYGSQGFYLKAVAVYKQILKLDPTVIQVNLRLAELYQQLGLLSDAQAQFEHAASFFQRSGRVREALDVMQKLVELDPDNIPSRIKLAELYSKENLREEAVREFGIAAEQLREQGRIDDFIKVAERLLWHKPDELSLGLELAEIYLSRNDPKRALAKLQQCFQADAQNLETLTLLARAFQTIGQIPKTISVYREMIRILKQQGDEPRLREVYGSILALNPNDAEAREALYGPQAAQPAPQQPLPGAPLEPTAAPPGEGPMEQPLAGGSPAGIYPSPGSGGLPPQPGQPASSSPYPGQPVIVDPLTETVPDDGPYGNAIPDQSISVHVETPSLEEPVEEVEEIDDMLVVEETENQETEIRRLLSETDVFVKYGLFDKAIEHLQQVFDYAPGHLEGREKLKDLYIQMGETERAIPELIYLADVYAEPDPERSVYYLQHILQIAPDYPAATERLRALGVEPSSAEYQETPTETYDEPSDLSMSIENALEESVDIEESSGLAAATAAAASQESTFETASSQEIASTAASGVSLEDELEEVEFFIQQGLLDEARNMLHELIQTFPNNPLVLEKLDELEEVHETGSLMSSSFDLSSQIPRELEGDADQTIKAEEAPVKDVFEQFKQGVSQQVDVGDADTHYDLGVAYKEMGLIEDAVAEFELARENPDREALAQTMIGHCYVQAGQHTEAINAYKRGLYADRKSEAEELELYYSLGTTYLALSDSREALYYFQKVVKREPNFRDVQQQIASIESGV